MILVEEEQLCNIAATARRLSSFIVSMSRLTFEQSFYRAPNPYEAHYEIYIKIIENIFIEQQFTKL